MTKISYKSVIAGLTLTISSFANAGLLVTQNNNSGDLVSNILGTGIATSNVSVTGAAGAFGTFSGGLSAGIGIDSGILLSTGNVSSAVGPNSSDSISTSHGTAGNADLSTLAGSGTSDAALLNFDFDSDSGDLFFNYVFASDEYNEFANSNFNDVFAFFVDGQNIALIPGTSTEVSINTVNGGSAGDGVGGVNSQYFNNNDLDNGGPFFDIEYDGFTDVFTATVTGLSAGFHNISIGIADVGDSAYDSAVFIQAGSFSSDNSTSIPEPSTIAIFALSLFGLASRKLKK